MPFSLQWDWAKQKVKYLCWYEIPELSTVPSSRPKLGQLCVLRSLPLTRSLQLLLPVHSAPASPILFKHKVSCNMIGESDLFSSVGSVYFGLIWPPQFVAVPGNELCLGVVSLQFTCPFPGCSTQGCCACYCSTCLGVWLASLDFIQLPFRSMRSSSASQLEERRTKNSRVEENSSNNKTKQKQKQKHTHTKSYL